MHNGLSQLYLPVLGIVECDFLAVSYHFSPNYLMIEILKQATQKIIGKSLSMKESKSIKFLRMVEPQLAEELDLSLTIKEDENGIHVRGALAKNDDIYFKEIVTFIGD